MRKRKELTLKNQMIRKYLLLITTLILALMFVVSTYFGRRLKEYRVSLTEGVMTTLTDAVQGKISEIRKIVFILRNSQIIRESLITGKLSTYAKQLISDSRTYDIKSIFLLDPRGNLISENGRVPIDVDELPGYKSYLLSGREDFFSGLHGYPSLDVSMSIQRKSSISYYFGIRDEEHNVSGTIVVVLTNNFFLFDKTKLMESEFQNVCIASDDGTVLYSLKPLTSMQKESVVWNPNQQEHLGQMCFYNRISLYPLWYLVGFVNSVEINQINRDLVFVILISGIVLIGFASVVTVMIAGQITGPLTQMSEFMKDYLPQEKGKRLKVRSKSVEVRILEQSINKMVDGIEHNIRTIIYEQEQNRKAEVEKVKYQLQSLQQQINPHFLYNTLNVIRYLVLEQRETEIIPFVQSFTMLLRASLSNMEEETTVSDEAEFLRAYIHIMEYRYQGMFHFHLSIDEEILNLRIPKLLLQPIVENAIIHGALPTGHLCDISVSMKKENEMLSIQIKDNGAGMPKEKLNFLFKDRQNFNGIALNNVNERLKLVYGNVCCLHIESRENEGTMVSLRIPIR